MTSEKEQLSENLQTQLKKLKDENHLLNEKIKDRLKEDESKIHNLKSLL